MYEYKLGVNQLENILSEQGLGFLVH